MKLKIGERYKISDKLRNAFGVNEKDAKVYSISGGIVMLKIGAESFPLKETIALNNLSSVYRLSASYDEVPTIKKEEDVPEIEINPESQPAEPEPETIVPEVVVPEKVVEPEPEEVIEPEPEEVVEPEEIEIENSISITIKPEVEKEPVIIEPEVQDNLEPEIVTIKPVEPEPTPEYNPDDDWGF